MKKISSFLLVFSALFIIIAINTKDIYAINSGEYLTYEEPTLLNYVNETQEMEFIINENEYRISVSYSYYSFENENGVRYYSADVLTNQINPEIDILKIDIYTVNSELIDLNDLTIMIILHLDGFEKLIKLESNFSEELLFDLNINNLLDEVIENRINEASNIILEYNSFLYEKYHQNNGNMQFNSLNREFEIIDDGGGGGGASQTIETMSRTDTHIDSYTLPNNSWRDSQGKIKDDNIINIVPKSNFFTTGTKYYMGTEYGMFMSTTKDSTYIYITDVFIFDIEVKKPGMVEPTDFAIATLTPKFQYRYYGRQKGTMSTSDWNNSYSSTLTSVVYPHLNYTSPNFYLKNIQFSFSVENKNSLNKGQSGYSIWNDFGDYVLDTSYIANGEGKSTNRDSIGITTANFILGFIPYLGPALSIIDYGIDLYKYFSYTPIDQFTSSNNNGTFTIGNSTGNYTNTYYKTSISDQEYYYGGLIKSVSIKPNGQSGNGGDPLLVGTRVAGHYAKGMVRYGGRNDRENSEESNLYVGVGTEIARDDTYYLMFEWFPEGSVTMVQSFFSNVIEQEPYQRTHKKVFVNTNKEVMIETVGKKDYFVFRPEASGTYTFYTTGSRDTYMYLYTASNVLIIQNDDGGEGVNSKVTVHLLKNEYYYIQVRLYSSAQTGVSMLNIRYGPTSSLSVNNQANITFNDNFKVYSFTPTVSKSYVLQTIGSIDTVMYIYNSSGTQVGYNNDHYIDGAINRNAKITVNLTAGIEYTVRVYKYGYGYGSSNIIVSPSN